VNLHGSSELESAVAGVQDRKKASTKTIAIAGITILSIAGGILFFSMKSESSKE
jgi:hypothetical protein